MKIWLVVKYYLMNISFKLHKDRSFRWGDMAKICSAGVFAPPPWIVSLGSKIAKWKAFLANPVLPQFFRFTDKTFIVRKTSILIPRFKCKNQFEKGTTLGWDICKNVFKHSTPNQTSTQLWVFSNLFLCWNREIEKVVWSMIKCRNRIVKYSKILSTNLKNHLKSPKLWGN